MGKMERSMKNVLTGIEAVRQARGCDIVLDDDGSDWTYILPIDSVQSLEKFDNRLSKDQNFRNRVVVYLARFATKNIPECIRQIFSELITDQLALKYSFQGRGKEKSNFSSLTLSDVIMSAVRSNTETLTCNLKDMQIEGGKYLTKAKSRIKQAELKKQLLAADKSTEKENDAQSTSSRNESTSGGSSSSSGDESKDEDSSSSS